MSEALILDYTIKAGVIIMLVSMLPIVIATLVGLIVSLMQALTQIQEQTLPFAIKLIAVFATLMLAMNWMGAELYNFTIAILDSIPRLAR
ncbi:MAG: type III secretion system export apparatus subunit SctS [Planctomycetota bacterium]